MRVYILAGEPSGDLIASGLMRALRRLVPSVEFRGVGGENMMAIGVGNGAGIATNTNDHNIGTERFKSLFDMSEISVMGFLEVVPRLPLIIRRIRQTISDIEAFRPDVLVTVDSWGFVSALLTKMRKKWRREAAIQIPVVHYVAPQVWAWKKGRAKNVARLVDRLMTLLPDERRWFECHGLRTDFVGHPIVERVADATLDPDGFRVANDISADATVVTVLPGSRHSETKRLIPILKEAVESVAAKIQNIFVVVPTVPGVEEEVRRGFEDMTDRVPISVVIGEINRYNAFKISKLAMAKSGTVSLELVSFGVPHMIVYTFGRLSDLIARRLVKVRFANLINILADREIIPELLLWKCRKDLIADCAMTLLESHQTANKQMIEATDVMQKLRLPDVLPSDRAAQIVAEMAGGLGNFRPTVRVNGSCEVNY
ncbi:MAG: lipid-A-disaccharide synthase [Alistipes sp.]|jgi:lipid-A-disaccharide synthase|nr:lipid-A-disaccharide synthase [Alistipes sp.]